MFNQSVGISQASPESGLSVVLVSVVLQGADQERQRKQWLQDLHDSRFAGEVFLIHLRIQDFFLCSPEISGQMVEALSLPSVFGWCCQLVVEPMTR